MKLILVRSEKSFLYTPKYLQENYLDFLFSWPCMYKVCYEKTCGKMSCLNRRNDPILKDDNFDA